MGTLQIEGILQWRFWVQRSCCTQEQWRNLTVHVYARFASWPRRFDEAVLYHRAFRTSGVMQRKRAPRQANQFRGSPGIRDKFGSYPLQPASLSTPSIRPLALSVLDLQKDEAAYRRKRQVVHGAKPGANNVVRLGQQKIKQNKLK